MFLCYCIVHLVMGHLYNSSDFEELELQKLEISDNDYIYNGNLNDGTYFHNFYHIKKTDDIESIRYNLGKFEPEIYLYHKITQKFRDCNDNFNKDIIRINDEYEMRELIYRCDEAFIF